MAESHRARALVARVAVAALGAWPLAASAQSSAKSSKPSSSSCTIAASDSSPATRAPDATLQSWADDAWLRFTDRQGSTGGRVSALGILQRFNRRMDAEYQGNLLTTRPSVDEDAEWWAHENGARIYAGSFDHAAMATLMDVRASGPIANAWRIGLRVQSEHDLEGGHDLARVRLTRWLAHGLGAYVESSVQSDKGDMDGTAGVQWCRGRASVAADVSVFDYVNNLLNDDEHLLRDLYYTTAYRYARQPVALRTTVRLPRGPWWVELQAAAVGPSRVRVDSLTAPGGVVQGEREGYDGVLLGRHLGARGQMGAFVSRVRARTDRAPLDSSGPEADDFVLVEATRQAGAFAVLSPTARWRVSLWSARTWRTETRDFRRSDSADVDYEDRALDLRMIGRYVPPASGVRFAAEAALDDRTIVRGRGEVLGRQPVPRASFARIVLMGGWGTRGRAELLLGPRFEHDLVDFGASSHAFLLHAGFQGRGTLYW
jgi:hypothetical protein